MMMTAEETKVRVNVLKIVGLVNTKTHKKIEM